MFSPMRSSHESGRQSSVQNGTLIVWPKLYPARPLEPSAVVIDALWMMRTSTGVGALAPGAWNVRARIIRSECVVADSGSPTTRNATLPVCAASRISSASSSTVSRCASVTSFS